MPRMLILSCMVLLSAALLSCEKRLQPPIVILIGIDGLHPDYLKTLHPPTLSRLAAQGVQAESMKASFPTLTFPNFYTLATGLRPENHGIVGNNMYDPDFREKFSLGSPAVLEGKWWGGEPVWVTAEKNGLRSACMFWPGSEAEIGGRRPSEYRKYSSEVSPDDRIRTVLEWLALPEAERPRLITLYFHEVDTAGHKFGPGSPEVAEALKQVDAALGKLLNGLRRLDLNNVNLLIVSDHGMAPVAASNVIDLSRILPTGAAEVDFAGPVVGLRPAGQTEEQILTQLRNSEEHFRAYRKGEIPDRLHFHNHRRIPPIVLIANEGWMIVPDLKRALPKGMHGYDPELPSMDAIFIGYGSELAVKKAIPAVENIQVYNLMCAILGLSPAPNDGDSRLVEAALRTPPVK